MRGEVPGEVRGEVRGPTQSSSARSRGGPKLGSLHLGHSANAVHTAELAVSLEGTNTAWTGEGPPAAAAPGRPHMHRVAGSHRASPLYMLHASRPPPPVVHPMSRPTCNAGVHHPTSRLN